MQIGTLLAAMVAAAALSGCTSFRVVYADGTVVESSGAALVSRQDNFTVTHYWIEAKSGDQHEVSVKRTTDENASAQLEALRYAFDAGKAASAPVKKGP